jgi:Glycosyltransferase family 6
MTTTALVTVVTGERYHRFAADMIESARQHFRPTNEVKFLTLRGREGPWPTGTMYRHHALARFFDVRSPLSESFDFVYLIDADMRFEGEVGAEVLPPNGVGITATLHPGYVGKAEAELPFERRLQSYAYVPPGEGLAYYAGGFVGGDRPTMFRLSNVIAGIVDADVTNGRTPLWHDESCLNKELWLNEPATILDPRYCCPDNAAWYQSTVWDTDYRADARIVALDKTSDERGDR